MFESLNPDKGSEGLTKAARLFYIVAGLATIAFVLHLVLLLTSSGGNVFALVHLAVAGALAYITGKGIDAQKPWAKWLGYVQGVLTLFNFPIGTIIGAAMLIYINRASKAGLFKPLPAAAA